MGFSLPGGFSPVQAVKQAAAVTNPIGIATNLLTGTEPIHNYDVFSEYGSQAPNRAPQVRT